jgi:hypothetical protein
VFLNLGLAEQRDRLDFARRLFRGLSIAHHPGQIRHRSQETAILFVINVDPQRLYLDHRCLIAANRTASDAVLRLTTSGKNAGTGTRAGGSC